jgi:hypothetical protein
MPISRECSCYHEAGHAVAWVANGDGLVMVVGYRDAPMEAAQRELYYDSTFGKFGEEGACSAAFLETNASEMRIRAKTIARIVDHFCSCGGGIRRASLYPPKAEYSLLNDDCPGCVKLFANHLTCALASSAATEHLLADEHMDAQAEGDRSGVRTLLERVVRSEQVRRDICIQVEQQAHDLVRREAKAIRLLAEVLLERGVLNGQEAEQIVKENLLAAT